MSSSGYQCLIVLRLDPRQGSRDRVQIRGAGLKAYLRNATSVRRMSGPALRLGYQSAHTGTIADGVSAWIGADVGDIRSLGPKRLLCRPDQSGSILYTRRPVMVPRGTHRTNVVCILPSDLVLATETV